MKDKKKIHNLVWTTKEKKDSQPCVDKKKTRKNLASTYQTVVPPSLFCVRGLATKAESHPDVKIKKQFFFTTTMPNDVCVGVGQMPKVLCCAMKLLFV